LQDAVSDLFCGLLAEQDEALIFGVGLPGVEEDIEADFVGAIAEPVGFTVVLGEADFEGHVKGVFAGEDGVIATGRCQLAAVVFDADFELSVCIGGADELEAGVAIEGATELGIEQVVSLRDEGEVFDLAYADALKREGSAGACLIGGAAGEECDKR